MTRCHIRDMDGQASPTSKEVNMFYGFEFTDGTNTTTTRDGKIVTAGSLMAFRTRAERDQWVAEGCDYRNGHAPFRRSVTTRDMPSGWAPREAWVLEADGESYPMVSPF